MGSVVGENFLDSKGVVVNFNEGALQFYALRVSDIGRALDELRPLVGIALPLVMDSLSAGDGPTEHVLHEGQGRRLVRRIQRCDTGCEIAVTFVDTDVLTGDARSSHVPGKTGLELDRGQRQISAIADAMSTLIAYIDVKQCYQFVNDA